MQIKFLTLGFISAAVFSNAVFAHGSVANVEDTHIQAQNLVANVLNHLNAKGLLKDANIDAASHVASRGGDHRLDRRRLHDALRRREWERDENEPDEEEEDENEPDEEEEDENEPDEEEEDEDEEDEDENEPDEEEEDEDEPDEDEADESSVAKVARRGLPGTDIIEGLPGADMITPLPGADVLSEISGQGRRNTRGSSKGGSRTGGAAQVGTGDLSGLVQNVGKALGSVPGPASLPL